jgi:hypothetical protein
LRLFIVDVNIDNISNFISEACGDAVVEATSRKVAGSRPDEANELLSVNLILQAAIGPGSLLSL